MRSSSEDLLNTLCGLAIALGRRPKIEDLPLVGLSVARYRLCFGSWRKALATAGLAVKSHRLASDTELLDLLRASATSLGRTPKAVEMAAIVGQKVYQQRFGSWVQAVQAAGLVYSYPLKSGVLTHGTLRAYIGYKCKCQACRENYSAYRRRRREERGLSTYKHYSEEEMLKALSDLAIKLGRTPATGEVTVISTGFSASRYYKHFGTWTKACTAAGLVPFCREYSDEDLLSKLCNLAIKLGRLPTMKDIQVGGPCYLTYLKHFGGLGKALALAGYTLPDRWVRYFQRKPFPKYRRYSDEDLLTIIRETAGSLGHTPKMEEVPVSCPTWIKHFGSWTNALIAAGFAPNLRRGERTHGTMTMYKNGGCRCQECREAMRLYECKRREKRRQALTT